MRPFVQNRMVSGYLLRDVINKLNGIHFTASDELHTLGALYESLLKSLEGEDVHRAYAGIALPNPASIALHEKFGFKRVAHFTEQGRKFGRYWDVAWFEKPLEGAAEPI